MQSTYVPVPAEQNIFPTCIFYLQLESTRRRSLPRVLLDPKIKLSWKNKFKFVNITTQDHIINRQLSAWKNKDSLLTCATCQPVIFSSFTIHLQWAGLISKQGFIYQPYIPLSRAYKAAGSLSIDISFIHRTYWSFLLSGTETPRELEWRLPGIPHTLYLSIQRHIWTVMKLFCTNER